MPAQTSDVSLVWIEETNRANWRWNVVICGRTYARCDSINAAKRIQKALQAAESHSSGGAADG